MSKQSEAKAAQGYSPTPRTCANCVSYRSVFVKRTQWNYGTEVQDEKDRHCDIGGFVVKKTATCNYFEAKQK